MNELLIHQILNGIDQARAEGKDAAFSYDRVSTTKQSKDGVSLKDQSERAPLYAAENNLSIIHNFSCVESAYKEGRKNFNKMLDLALKYKIKHIIFKNTDRLGRNDIDWPRCKKLARENGLFIHLYELGTIFCQTSTAETEMFLDNTSSMAKYWSNKISQGIKANHRRKIKEGTAPVRFAPLGYRYDKITKKHIIDEATKNLVEYIFDLFDNNKFSLEQIKEDLDAKGYKSQAGTKWSKSGLHNMLRNPFYTGKFRYKGELYDGNHPAYITKDQYEVRLNKLSNKFVGKKKRNTTYLFKNFLRYADSGRIMSGETKTGAHKSGTYIYYVQPKPEYFIVKEEWIFDSIDKEIEKIKFNEDFADFTRSVFKDAVNEQAKSQTKELSYITKKIVQIEKEQQKLLNLLIEGIDEKTVKVRMDENRKVIDRLENERQKLRLNKQDFVFAVSDIIERSRELPDLYNKMTNEEKAELIREMADGITVYKDFLEIHWKKPYSFILNDEVLQFNRVRTYPFNRARVDDFRTLIYEKICPEWQYWFTA